MSNIYEMNLHEKIFSYPYEIKRVPGGWLYLYFPDTDSRSNSAPVFVPFDNEFMPVQPEWWKKP